MRFIHFSLKAAAVNHVYWILQATTNVAELNEFYRELDVREGKEIGCGEETHLENTGMTGRILGGREGEMQAKGDLNQASSARHAEIWHESKDRGVVVSTSFIERVSYKYIDVFW